MLKHYSKALLITYNVAPEEEERLRYKIREVVAEIERDMFLDGYYKAFGMGAGPCHLCEECDVKKPCNRPHEARPSMEASGIDVYQTMRNAGLKIEVVKYHKMLCTFCGLILIE
jgi:predicted metal-binding protein